jgi:hypothetical protein
MMMADLITIEKKLDRIIELLERIADVEPASEAGDDIVNIEPPDSVKDIVAGWKQLVPPNEK